MALTAIQKQALKEVLHLIVDKEEPAVVQELLSKLPAPYASIAGLVFSAVNPTVESTVDGAVDKALS